MDFIIQLPTVNNTTNKHGDRKLCEDGHHPVKIGDIILNTYIVEDKLGVGGSSAVWRCLDMQNNSLVAMKIINSKSIYTEIALHEISMLDCVKLGNLSNTAECYDNRNNNFVQLLHHFNLSGPYCTHMCMVFEYMEGNLFDLMFNIEGGREIILCNIKDIIKQIFDSLDYLHTPCQLIHTDIKGENILYRFVNGKLTVKISDLGSACSLYHPYREGLQTYVYRSHEFLLGAPIGPSADIWSMACLVFFLATGCNLFNSEFGADYSQDDDHLAVTIALLGDIPKHVALSGVCSLNYFYEDGTPRHISRRIPQNLVEVLTQLFQWDLYVAQHLANFVLPMLAFDPKQRPAALDCLQSPWLQS